jgi:hypothetical protein
MSRASPNPRRSAGPSHGSGPPRRNRNTSSDAESRTAFAGTGYGMTIGAFDLDETLADLRSDEGIDPAMLIVPMPERWLAAFVIVFATQN